MNKPPQIPHTNSQTIRDREKSIKIDTYEENHNIEKDHCRKLSGFEIFTLFFCLSIIIGIIAIIIFNS
jgi:hypothetical protein